MSDYPSERARVYDNIAPLIKDFAGDVGSRTFHAEELRRYVKSRTIDIAPGSPDRILRQLRLQKVLDYVVISRSKSLYQFCADGGPDMNEHTLPGEAHSSLIGGSSAERRMNCPGSWELEQKVPATADKSSVYADEGTALHEAMQYMLTTGTGLDDVLGMTFGISETSPVGYVMTQELVDAALAPCMDFFDALENECFADDGDFIFRVECKCEMPGIPDAFGTSDIIFKTPKRSGVVDWKFGAGVPVKAEYPDGEGGTRPNAQPMFYGRAGMHTFPEMFSEDPSWPVDIYIVQPRGRDVDPNEPFTKTSTTVKALENFRMQLIRTVAEMKSGNARIAEGPWCKFAKCKTVCPIHTGAAIDLTKMQSQLQARRKGSVLGGIDINWGVMYAELLDLADMAEAVIGEIRAQAHAFADEGNAIVYEDGSKAYKLVDKRPSENYVDELGAVEMCQTAYKMKPEEVMEPAKTKSPAQLRAALAEKLPPAVHGKTKKAREEAAAKLLSKYTTKISSGTTLAHASDTRREFIPIASTVAALSAKLAALKQ